MLSSGPMVPSTSVGSSGVPSPSSDTFDDNPNRLTTYLHQLAGCYEVEVDVIVKDHCYARPWNWKPENIYVKPIKKLFFAKTSPFVDKHRQDEEIDVEGNGNESTPPPFDLTRARHLMDEFQRLANFARPDENEDWEEKIDKMLWTPVQNRIFLKVVKILSSERLARLAKINSPMEPIFRRTSVDMAARRFRETLASASWDHRITQWLHSLLFDHLPQEYLAIYLDILQTLRQKIPQLVDKMIAVQPNINAKGGSITWETLGSLLKRSWDPVASSLNTNRLKKLPGNPILIIAPSGVGPSMSSRQHKWISHLGALGMVVTVHTHLGLAANRMTMMVCIDQLVQATRTKIQDVRSDCPGRPIILVGYNTGAALACQMAQLEHVTAVICLGFPFATVEGKRGTPDDTLMDIRCPVMFIIGQNATLVRPDDLEDLREKMLVETSLVVVGTADDHLRISTAKKISEGITQSMVDRCILDEIGDFVGSILLQPHPLPLRPTSMSNYENKTGKKEIRKRKNSTSSSVESEPNSPTMKKSRPTTPISSAAPVPSNLPPAGLVKSGTLSTQPTLVAVSGSHATHSSTLKRKPRVVSNPKAQFVEHLISARHPGQQSISSTNGGITLNIGSLASLAPIGPIRLAPASVDQTTGPTTKVTGASKSTMVPAKMPKIIPASVPFQNVSKMKAIVSTNKSFSKVMSSNYKQINVTDKSGDAKLINVLTTSGNQMKVNTSTSAAMHGKQTIGTSSGTTLSTLLQNGKSSLALTTSSSLARASSTSSILLTPNNSAVNNIVAATTATSKETDGTESSSHSSSQRVPLNSTHSLDISKISQLPLQAVGSKDNSLNVPCGNVVMLTETSHGTRAVPSSVIVPFSNHNSATLLPLSNKLKTSHKPMKAMPKITVNPSSLQRIQRTKTQTALKKNGNDMDDDLGNILDIPIIFAKDDDNLGAIDKVSSFSKVPSAVDSYDRNASKLNNTTKVVLISNKQDKLSQTTNKLVTTSAHTIICPNVPAQNVNHVILQTRPQSATVCTKAKSAHTLSARPNHPTIKYTKIILAKRNTLQPSHQSDKSGQVILTKSSQRIGAPKLLDLEKSEHHYAQAPSKMLAQCQDSFADDVLEIEDAIKTNIIERKSGCIPEIDLTSPTKFDETNETLGEGMLTEEQQRSTECNTLFNSIEQQT